LISILPLARSGERAVNRDLAVVKFASHSTPLPSDADTVFSCLGDAHAIDDQCSLVALDRFGNAFPKLSLNVFVFPWTLTDKSFKPFLIDVHFLSDVSDGIGTSGAQQAPEVPACVQPCPFVLRPR